jgi:hypothetical protein
MRAALVLAAVLSCAGEPPIVEPVPAARRLHAHQRWAVEECRWLGGMPLVSSYEAGGYLGIAATCVRAPVASLGGRRP